MIKHRAWYSKLYAGFRLGKNSGKVGGKDDVLDMYKGGGVCWLTNMAKVTENAILWPQFVRFSCFPDLMDLFPPMLTWSGVKLHTHV